MSQDTPKDVAEYLPDEDMARLAESIAPQLPDAVTAARMKARILQNARTITLVTSQPTGSPALFTLRLDEREWQPIARGVEMCTLREDEFCRTILLRMQPDSFLLPHQHEMSEESFILEGDALIGDDLHLNAGDYHYSPAGALHPLLQSPKGCVVMVRGEKGFSPRPTLGLFKRLLRGRSPGAKP